VPSIAKVLPVPTKFSAVMGPDEIGVPAEEMPRLKPPTAVTTPETLASPTTVSFDVGLMVPIPTEPFVKKVL
jgi:hypothetical protein